MKRNEIIFIIVLLAIVSIAIGMTQPTKIPFLKFWESSSKAAPDGKGALKLDENGVLSGISVSAEETTSNPDYALAINGKLRANGCAGPGVITTLQKQVFISNANVTDNSLIFITVGGDILAQIDNELYVYEIKTTEPKGFTVKIMNDAVADKNIPFSYLIIN